MKTPPMFMPQEDGKLVEIPEEHAAVLELYRERMPVVWEIQETGPHYFYDLIDVDAEPYGTPRPGALESVARRTAAVLKKRRLGEDPPAPDLERLALEAVRAYVTDMADFAAAVAHGESPAAVSRAAQAEARRAGARVAKTVEDAVRDTATAAVK
ncbi:hypothetical protein [Streptomyces tendae]|uniref:hypothetical protein n=1 Tax=Streptomyces tendae TaxID=1932 RepID=UPI0036F82642